MDRKWNSRGHGRTYYEVDVTFENIKIKIVIKKFGVFKDIESRQMYPDEATAELFKSKKYVRGCP